MDFEAIGIMPLHQISVQEKVGYANTGQANA